MQEAGGEQDSSVVGGGLGVPWRGLGQGCRWGSLPRDCRGERVRLSPAGPTLEVGTDFGLYTRPGRPQRPHWALTGFLLFPPVTGPGAHSQELPEEGQGPP